MTKLKLLLGQWLANMTRKLKNNFYIYLAALFTVLVLLDASVFGVGLNMRDRAFDFMVKYRVIQPQADPDIIIVDINEASLHAFAKEFGSWPWSRQVMGEFVENIQAQKPKAIVFEDVYKRQSLRRASALSICFNCNKPSAALNSLIFPLIPGATTFSSPT